MSAYTSVLRGPKDIVAKTRNVTRTMTTAAVICTLPKGSRPLYAVISGTPSDAVTSAVVGLGTTSSATELITGHDVKTAATGRHAFMVTTAASSFGTVLTADTPIYAKYTQVGGDTVGAWKVTIFYSTGNLINDDTL